VLLVVLGLVGLALWRFGAIGPGRGTGQISNEELAQTKGGVESARQLRITTVKDTRYVARRGCPRSREISSYKPMADSDRPLRDSTSGGWKPIIYANNGFKAAESGRRPAARISSWSWCS